MRKFGRIFGIGLSRTGTTSLSHALMGLGLRVVHFPATIHDIMAHDAATDSRVAAQFETLDEYIPNSLFIHTTRDVSDWLRSCEKFWAAFDHFAKAPAVQALHTQLYGAAEFDRATYADAFARHRARVDAHFARRPEVLLRMDICGGDGWEPLAQFLEVPVPPLPFPYERAPGGSRN